MARRRRVADVAFAGTPFIKQRGPLSTIMPVGFGDVPPQGLIGNPNIQGRLVRALNLRERAPAPTLAPEIVPVIVVENLAGLEQSGLNVVRACTGAMSSTTDTINGPSVSFQNAPQTQMYMRVKRILISTSVLGEMKVAWQATVHSMGTPVDATSERFNNLELTGVPKAQIIGGLGGFPVDVQVRYRTSANTTIAIEEPTVLSPGSHMIVGHDVISAGAQILVSFWWDEYPVNP